MIGNIVWLAVLIPVALAVGITAALLAKRSSVWRAVLETCAGGLIVLELGLLGLVLPSAS